MIDDADRAGSSQDNFVDAVVTACRELGLSLSADQTERMWRHYALMVEENRCTNLTRITDPVQAAVKHYADSLALLPWAHETVLADAYVLDVGTGAGFPAVPLAICRPAWRILAIDSTKKKMDFVATAAASLGLDCLSVQHARARELAGHVAPFDLVTCRAVADLVKCLREVRRLIAGGGWLVCYTSPRTLDRLTPSQRAQADRLGFEPPHRHGYRLILPDGHIDRVLTVWQRRT